MTVTCARHRGLVDNLRDTRRHHKTKQKKVLFGTSVKVKFCGGVAGEGRPIMSPMMTPITKTLEGVQPVAVAAPISVCHVPYPKNHLCDKRPLLALAYRYWEWSSLALWQLGPASLRVFACSIKQKHWMKRECDSQ